MTNTIFTAPNIITIIRAGMLVMFWYFIQQGRVELGLTIFFVSWALDAIDGYVARTFNQVTELGSYLDKIIDRATMAVGVVVLIRYGIVPAYALLLFTREYGTLPVTYPVKSVRHSWQGAGVLGKVTTFGEGAGLLWLALGLPYGVMVVAVVAALGSITAFSYLRKVFAVLCIAAIALPAHAGLVINEVMWDGSEYIELFNTENVPVALHDWKLTKGNCADPDEAEGTIIVFSEEDGVDGGGYALIQKNETSTTLLPDVITSSLVLLQGGDMVALCNEERGLVDHIDASSGWPAGENTDVGIAMERGDSGWYSSTGFVGGRNGTPGQGNSVFQPTPSATAISPTASPSPAPVAFVSPNSFQTNVVINEFLPNPTGSDAEGEFIELYNPSDTDSDLSGWQIDDAEGGSKPYVLPEDFIVAAGAYVVIMREDSGIALNNTADSVRLLDPDDALHQEVVYDFAVPEAYTLNRNENGDFLESVVPTPGEKNNISTPSPTPVPSAVSTSVKAQIAGAVTESSGDDQAGNGDLAGDIKIFEVLPNPEGLDGDGEFISLKNMGSNSVDISGWEIDDAEGGSRPYTIPAGTSIAPGEVLVFTREETAIALNNTSDSVRLFSPSGTLVDEFTYSSVSEGQVFQVLDNKSVTETSKSGITKSSGVSNAQIAVPARLTEGVESLPAITQTDFSAPVSQSEPTHQDSDRRRDMLRGILLLAGAAMVGIVAFEGDQLALELGRLWQSVTPKSWAS